MHKRLILCGVVLFSSWMLSGCGSSGGIEPGMNEVAPNQPAPDVDMGNPVTPDMDPKGGAPPI